MKIKEYEQNMLGDKGVTYGCNNDLMTMFSTHKKIKRIQLVEESATYNFGRHCIL
jgi:hypothetical protein